MGPILNSIPREKLRRLAGELLSLASEKFSHHSCNDFARPDYFTEAEWSRMTFEYQIWNSNGQDEPTPMGDSTLMAWLAKLAEVREL